MTYILIIALLAGHGLAHVSGFLASFTNKDLDFHLEQPCIFSGRILLNKGLGRIFGLLWLIAAFILLLSAIALLLKAHWWLNIALAGAVVSLVTIISFWNSIPPGAKIGAVFDLIVVTGITGFTESLIQLTA